MMIFHYNFAIVTLLLCLVLAGTYTYFGYHVVRRGVIFVDLSLAQVAALGSSIGVMFGWGEQFPVQNYLMSLSFTLLGALLFVVFRSKRQRVPIEALIGITYAGAIALSLIVLERSATGTEEEIKEMLAGSLLTVSPKEVSIIAVLCAVIGVIHWFSRKQLLLVTEEPDTARRKGMKIWWWDFVFYATFGMIVTSSVKVAGVLMVFAFLIIPAVAAMIAVNGITRRILFGCLFGVVGCLTGLELSLRLDWSSGPTIVAVFLVLLTGTWGIKRLLAAQHME